MNGRTCSRIREERNPRMSAYADDNLLRYYYKLFKIFNFRIGSVEGGARGRHLSLRPFQRGKNSCHSAKWTAANIWDKEARQINKSEEWLIFRFILRRLRGPPRRACTHLCLHCGTALICTVLTAEAMFGPWLIPSFMWISVRANPSLVEKSPDQVFTQFIK